MTAAMRASAAVLVLTLVAALPAQDPCATLLDRVAATAHDPGARHAMALDAFRDSADDAACTLAAILVEESFGKVAGDVSVIERIGAMARDAALTPQRRAVAARLAARLRATALGRADYGIRKFQVIGPFGFAAESLEGFEFPPEREIALDRTYDGFDGKVSWRRYDVSPCRMEADLFEILEKDGAAYAFTQVEVPADAVMRVRLESQHGVELFVDGVRVLVLAHRRETMPLAGTVELAFPKGWHRFLVKTLEPGGGSFALSLLDAAGAPAFDLNVDADALHAVERPATATGPAGAFVSRDVRALIPFAGGRAHDLVVAAIWCDAGVPEEAYAAVEDHVAAADLGLGEIWAAMRIIEAAEHLPENDRQARLRALCKRALELEAHWPPAAIWIANDDATKDRIEEGIEKLARVIEAHPACVEARLAAIALLSRAGFDSDHDKALAEAVKACPHAVEVMRQQIRHLDRKGAVEEWTKVASVLAERDRTDVGLARSLAESLRRAARYYHVGVVIERARSQAPHDRECQALLAGICRDLGDEEGERKILEDMTAANPRATAGLVTLANRAEARGRKDEAIGYWKRALERDPDLAAARRALAVLDPPKHDYFAEFAVDSAAFLKDVPGPDAYPDSRIVMLLDQIVLWVKPDGSAEQETHQIQRLQDARGKEDLGTIHAEGDVYAVHTILPDGTKLVPNYVRAGYEMAGLKPGVLVEKRFRRSLWRAKGRPVGFGGFYFQDTELTQPFHYSRYVVVIPKALGLEPIRHHFDAEFKREERGDDIVYTFLMERVPRIQRETMMPEPEELVPHVEFRQPDEWVRINRRYRDAYEPVSRPTPPIVEAARKAVGDATDPIECARRLYEFVMDTIESEDGRGWPTQTLLEKSGDRFGLYLALLRGAGVPYTIAMGRGQEKLSPKIRWELVEEGLFEAPLVRVDAPGKAPVYVTTQFRYAPFGYVPFEMSDAPVFVTSADGGRIERTPAKPLDEARVFEYAMNVALDDEGVGKGTVRFTLRGSPGMWIKEQIVRTDKKRLDQMANGMVLGPIGRLAPRPQGSARFLNATSRTEPLVVEIDVEVRQIVKKSDDGATLGIPFPPAQLARAFVDRKERKLPFVFRQYEVQRHEATIDLGTFKLTDLPADFERAGPLGSFSLHRSLDGTRLTIRRDLKLTPTELPASAFPDVASFCRDVDEAESQKLELRKHEE